MKRPRPVMHWAPYVLFLPGGVPWSMCMHPAIMLEVLRGGV